MSDGQSRYARQRSMLHAMQIGPLWVTRTAPSNSLAAADEQNMTDAEVQPQYQKVHGGFALASEQPSSEWDATPAASSESEHKSEPKPSTLELISTTDADIASMDWDELQSTVASCTRCPLCQSRNRTVFGVGDQRARWLLIGEGPGRNEDQQGEPFVGPAGKLLDNMLQSIDLKRGENNFVANVVKCRPTDANGRDRAPTSDEIAACRPYLERQIALVKPTIIVAFGKVAAHALLGSDPKTSLAALRGSVHRRDETPLVVTYHPAYLLRKPLDKSMSWQDLCLARQAVSEAEALGG